MRGLYSQGFVAARLVAQEHSGIHDLWAQRGCPDVLIYLDAQVETMNRRQGRSDWTEEARADERAVTGYLAGEEWSFVGRGYLNLAELYVHLGELAKSTQAAQQALDLARRAENKQDERHSLAYQARAAHLRGELEAAVTAFQQTDSLDREIQPQHNHLDRNPGIWYADYVHRTGDTDYARRVTEANLEICEYNHWEFLISMCHRVLGDLGAGAGQLASARGHYDEALKIARSISHRPALIEALLARGRFFARHPGQDLPGLAFNDLNEALGYALAGGYRIYEADIRIALAWAHLALSPKLAAGQPPSPEIGRGKLEPARAEAERALQMSEAMGYYWGKVDAQEVLGVIARRP